MAQDNAWWKNDAPVEQSSGTDWLKADKPVEEDAPARGFKGWAQDIGATALKGAIGVPEALVGLADIPTGGAVGKFLENEGGAIGFRPKQAKEIANEWHSDATKQAQRKFQAAEGIGGKLQAAIENPSIIATSIGESLPAMGAGGVAARGILGATRLGAMGAKGAAIAGAAGEGAMMAGQQAESIRQETEDGYLTPGQSALAAGTGLIGGVVGAASGRLANKLGIGDVDTMVAQGAKSLAAPAAQGTLKSIPKKVIQGAMTEGLLEELPQSVVEQVMQNLALGKDWSEGVDEAVVLGALSGGAMGGGASGFKGYMDSRKAPEQAPAQPPVQPPAEQPQPMGASLTGTAPADLMARGTDPLAGQIAGARVLADDAAVTRNDFSDRNGEALAGGGMFGSRADPLANMLADQRTSDANTSVNIQRAAEKRPPMPATAAANILVAAQEQDLDFTVAPHPDGGYLVIPRAWVTPQVAKQAEASLRETLARVAQVEDAPIQRAARVSTNPAALDLNTDAVAGYVDNLRTVNTPAAKAFVGEFDAGRITRQDVEQRMAVERGKTADERLAEAAAQARAPQDPYSLPAIRLSQAMGLNPAAGPMSSAAVIAVDGGAYNSVRAAQTTTGEPTNGTAPDQAFQAGAQQQEAQPAPANLKPPRGILAKKADADAARAARNPNGKTIQPATEAATDAGAVAPPAVRSAGVSGVDEQGAVPALSNVQNPQSRPAGAETQAAPVEAPAPARGDAAATAGVPATPGAGDVQADGLKIAEAAHQAATSHKNDLPQPTDAQKEAGNYVKGHVTINGHGISIENPAGSKRRPEWPPLKNHYGYFKGSVGADKDHVDLFMTDRAGDASLPVFVVDQTNRDGTFDEAKVIMGAADEAEARATYLQNYEKGWTGLGAITQMSQDEFKAWVRDPAKTKKPVALKRGVLAKLAEQKAKKQAAQSQAKPDRVEQRKTLEKIAERLGITVYKGATGWHATGDSVSIPDADVDAQGAIHPNHVFAHEIAHVVMTKRGFTFQGFPKAEVVKRVVNYDALIAASKEFRPGVHNHEDDRFRRHAMKPNEVMADGIASVLLGDKPISLIEPLMEFTGMTRRDLGLDDAAAKSQAEPVKPEPAPQPKMEKPASKSEFKVDRTFLPPPTEEEFSKGARYIIGSNGAKERIEYPGAASDAGQADDAFMGAKNDEPRTLVAMHNLTAENLLYADSMGGIPVPSIGITKIDTPFSGFGDVTLIAPSSMVDPEQGTPVFDRDAWTARFPTMNFKKVRAKVADAFYERMKPARQMGDDGDSFTSLLWEQLRNANVQSPDKVADLFRRYNAAKLFYAKEVLGKDIKVPMKSAPLSSPAANDKQLQAYWKKNGQRLVEIDRELSGFEFSNSPEYKEFIAEVEGAVRRYAESTGRPERAGSYVSMFLPDGSLGPGGFRNLRDDFDKVGEKVIDGIKFNELIRKAVPDNDPAYQAWVKSLVDPLFEAPTITVRGREVAPTLDNIVESMTIGATQGAEKSLTFGPGKTAAMLGKRFKSMAEIKAARDQVVSQAAEADGKKATEAILDEYRTRVASSYKYTDWRGNIDTWAANDAAMEALAKAGKAGGSNADIRQALVRAGFKLADQTTIDLASQSIKALRNAATDYFEAKPQRAVKLNEFRGAVIPKGASQEVKDTLTKNGIEFIEFNKSADGARDSAIQKMARRVDKAAKDILFAGDRSAQAQGTPTDRAVMAMAGEGKSADEILRFIANASKSPFNRQIANLLRRTKANPAVSIGGDMGGGAGFKFLAKYSRKNHEVTLSEAASGKAEQIFLHETVHAATLLALDRGGEHAARMKALYESVKAQGLSDAYGMKNVGEFVAEAFTNPDFQKLLKGYKAPGGTAWDRFVAAVRRILGLSYQSQDALSATLELGVEVMRENVPLRKARSFSAEDAPAFAGVDQTQTEAFRKWFGDSKVVDSAGKPLRVFHGTSKSFDQFSSDQQGSNFDDYEGAFPRDGFWFTKNPDNALWYSNVSARGLDGEREGGGQNTVPVYLAIKNPYRYTVEMFAEEGEAGIPSQFDLEKQGYDGIIVEVADEDVGAGMPAAAEAMWQKYTPIHGAPVNWPADLRKEYGDLLNTPPTIKHTHYVAFRPGQIKSATGNNGNFDPEDADIAHFGMADAASLKNSALDQIKQFDVKTAPKNTWAHYRGMAMQALGRRQIVDLYAEELPQLEHYNDLVQRMDAEKNESGAEADNLAQEWGKLKNGEDRTLAELMHDATLAQMDPSKAQEPGTLTIQYKALEARYKALTPEARALFGKARDMYKAHYTAVQRAIKERIERSEMSDGQKRQIMARMDEELFKELKGVYFPLARFGQYVIVVKDANGEVKNVTRSETVKEAEAARKELQKAFPAHMGNTVGKVLKQAEFNAGRDAVGKGFMADLMGALDKNGIDDELRDTVAQLYLSSLPDLSWAKHGIHRKGTPGFSQDARRAFAQNMFHGARYLAKLRYADQLQDQLTAMQDHIKAYESVEEYDSVEAQQVVDEMVKRHEFMMNPKSSPVSTALTSFGFLFHMGLSPASAMVNLTQTALVAFPQMGAKWGFGKASAALIKASEETVRAKNDLSKVLKGDELEALNKAINDGTIDVTMAHDLAGISQGEDQGVMWKVRPVMRAASFMFHHAEKFNRQATFLAAYRLAKEANPTRAFDRLYEDAQKATYDGHFDYSAGNRPRIMQGNWQKVIFLFKQYATNMLYTLSRNAYQSVKALDPKDRAQARKTLAGLLAAHAAAAGVLGLPIVGQLLAVASFLGSDDDEPWDAEVAMQNAMAELLGPKAAEVMARGLSRLTPWDLSGRVALNKLILPDVQEGLEGKAWAESAMAAALGPVAGIGVNVARGMQKITDGDYMRGIEDMLPTALRGPIKALRYANEGAVDKTGIVITDEVSVAGVIGQASGFSPSQVRRDTERRSAIYSYDKALTDRRSALMRMFADAQMNGDTETVLDVRQDIAAFNEKNPNRRITVPNLMQSVRNRQRRIDQAQDGIYLPKNRRDALDAVTF